MSNDYQADISLDLCMSSWYSSFITLSQCPEIIVDQFNHEDIASSINQRLAAGSVETNVDWSLLKDDIQKNLPACFSGRFSQ